MHTLGPKGKKKYWLIVRYGSLDTWIGLIYLNFSHLDFIYIDTSGLILSRQVP